MRIEIKKSQSSPEKPEMAARFRIHRNVVMPLAEFLVFHPKIAPPAMECLGLVREGEKFFRLNTELEAFLFLGLIEHVTHATFRQAAIDL